MAESERIYRLKKVSKLQPVKLTVDTLCRKDAYLLVQLFFTLKNLVTDDCGVELKTYLQLGKSKVSVIKKIPHNEVINKLED